MSIKEIVEKIFEMEEELDLFSKRIDGVPFWELIRFEVVSQIAQQKGIYGQAHTKLEIDREYYGQYLLNGIKNCLIKNPFFSPQSDILFLGHSRRKFMEDGRWWDVYSDPLIDHLVDTFQCLLEKPYLNAHLSPAKTPRMRYLDLALLIGAVMRKLKLVRFSLTKHDETLLTMIEREIKKRLEASIELKIMVAKKIRGRKSLLPLYSILLKKIRPKIAVVVCSYGLEVFIEACKIRGVPVVELQHGTISRYHTGYSFPSPEGTKMNFPDYFFAFGDYWKDLVEFPIEKNKIVSVGYPFFEMETAKYKNEPKKDQILFISQGTIGARLSKFAVDLKARNDFRWEIVYKMHPGESARWKKEYPWLIGSGIKVVDDDSIPLYKLMAQSKALVGVYSTVVYEGLGLGLPTFLLDLPGLEYMDELVESQAVTVISSPEELVVKIVNTENKAVSSDSFFKPRALENITEALGKVITDQGEKTGRIRSSKCGFKA